MRMGRRPRREMLPPRTAGQGNNPAPPPTKKWGEMDLGCRGTIPLGVGGEQMGGLGWTLCPPPPEQWPGVERWRHRLRRLPDPWGSPLTVSHDLALGCLYLQVQLLQLPTQAGHALGKLLAPLLLWFRPTGLSLWGGGDTDCYRPRHPAHPTARPLFHPAAPQSQSPTLISQIHSSATRHPLSPTLSHAIGPLCTTIPPRLTSHPLLPP